MIPSTWGVINLYWSSSVTNSVNKTRLTTAECEFDFVVVLDQREDVVYCSSQDNRVPVWVLWYKAPSDESWWQVIHFIYSLEALLLWSVYSCKFVSHYWHLVYNSKLMDYPTVMGGSVNLTVIGQGAIHQGQETKGIEEIWCLSYTLIIPSAEPSYITWLHTIHLPYHTENA